MARLTTIEDFLKAEVAMIRAMNATRIGNYVSLGDFVLTNGRRFNPTLKLPPGIKCGRLGHCFRNAATLAIDRNDLIYCEGYAAGVLPVLHAWLCDKDGNVIDPTWCRDVKGESYMGTEYFGVPISQKYLIEHLCEHEKYGLVDAWEARWPMLQLEPKQFIHPKFKTP